MNHSYFAGSYPYSINFTAQYSLPGSLEDPFDAVPLVRNPGHTFCLNCFHFCHFLAVQLVGFLQKNKKKINRYYTDSCLVIFLFQESYLIRQCACEKGASIALICILIEAKVNTTECKMELR